MFKMKNIVVLFTVLAALGLSGDVWGMNEKKPEEKNTNEQKTIFVIVTQKSQWPGADANMSDVYLLRDVLNNKSKEVCPKDAKKLKDILNSSGRQAKEIKTTEANMHITLQNDLELFRALQKFEVNLLSYKPFKIGTYDFNNKTLALLDPSENTSNFVKELATGIRDFIEKELSDRTKRLENVKNVIREAANTYYNSFAAFMFSLFTGTCGYVLPKNNVSLAAKIGLSGLLSWGCTEKEQGKLGKACVYAAGLVGLYTGNKIMSGAHHVAAKVVSGIQSTYKLLRQ